MWKNARGSSRNVQYFVKGSAKSAERRKGKKYEGRMTRLR